MKTNKVMYVVSIVVHNFQSLSLNVHISLKMVLIIKRLRMISCDAKMTNQILCLCSFAKCQAENCKYFILPFDFYACVCVCVH